MKNVTKSILKKIKDKFPITRYLWSIGSFFIGKSSLHKLGWFKSARKMSSIDINGNPIPWLTYAAVDFLEKKISKNSKYNVFEYGSGNSTFWWANRVKKVTSIEYDQGWFELISSKMPKNVDLRYVRLEDGYEKAVTKGSVKYDIIVIDGRMRVECAKNSVHSLKSGGVIIWDNTERERYSRGIQYLERNNFRRIDFYGPAPIDNVVTQTSVFYRDSNVLGI